MNDKVHEEKPEEEEAPLTPEELTARTSEELTPRLVPVIMCGGSGDRLWPLSRRTLPKQFLNFGRERSLFADTVVNVGKTQLENMVLHTPIVVTDADHAGIVQHEMGAIKMVGQYASIEEVNRKNTLGVIMSAVLAAKYLRNSTEEDVVACIPADHSYDNDKRLSEWLQRAAQTIEVMDLYDQIMLIGITPSFAATQYGYIKGGENLVDEETLEFNVYSVNAFFEKPDELTASKMVKSGGYFWNSGIFVGRVSAFMALFEKHCPEQLKTLQAIYDEVRAEGPLEPNFALKLEYPKDFPAEPFDKAVMEKTNGAAVMITGEGWSDVGSFEQIRRMYPHDDAGNAIVGDFLTADCRNSTLINTEQKLVVAYGVQELLLVNTPDALLVAPRKKFDEKALRGMLDTLRKSRRVEAVDGVHHIKPWGRYTDLFKARGLLVKELVIEAKQAFSLQYHLYRSELWFITDGVGHLTLGKDMNDVKTVKRGDVIQVPQGEIHRLANPGHLLLKVLEVQYGDLISEGDIVRLADNYGRAPAFRKGK